MEDCKEIYCGRLYSHLQYGPRFLIARARARARACLGGRGAEQEGKQHVKVEGACSHTASTHALHSTSRGGGGAGRGGRFWGSQQQVAYKHCRCGASTLAPNNDGTPYESFQKSDYSTLGFTVGSAQFWKLPCKPS